VLARAEGVRFAHDPTGDDNDRYLLPEGSVLRLSEALVAALLAVICCVFALRAPQALPLHAALLVAFLATAALARRHDGIRAFALVAVLMTLYSTLAEPAFVAMHGAKDATLAAIDRAIAFGHDPALAAQHLVTAANLEVFSFIYGFFIPYLWLSILLGCVGRPRHERAAFLLGLTITYTLAYLGYLFVPARGPVELYAFAAPLHGGRFHRIVLDSVVATGGNHGAFPSLHVGASAYLCLFDLRRNPLRGMTYAPMVVLISIATIFLRYHYVIDIVTGLTIALLAFAATERAA
jgi:hypothetical protein